VGAPELEPRSGVRAAGARAGGARSACASGSGVQAARAGYDGRGSTGAGAGVGGSCRSWSWSRAVEARPGLICVEWVFCRNFIYWIKDNFTVEDSKRRMGHEKMDLLLEIA
jgi:hypothetical protein